jgi:hypothetical protein
MLKFGTKAQVFHGSAEQTTGGLRKAELFQDSKDGRIKSRAQSNAGKSNPALKAWRDAVEKAKTKTQKKKDMVLVKGALATKARKEFKKMYD